MYQTVEVANELINAGEFFAKTDILKATKNSAHVIRYGRILIIFTAELIPLLFSRLFISDER